MFIIKFIIAFYISFSLEKLKSILMQNNLLQLLPNSVLVININFDSHYYFANITVDFKMT